MRGHPGPGAAPAGLRLPRVPLAGPGEKWK